MCIWVWEGDHFTPGMGGYPVTKSSAPSALYIEALFRQAGIYLAGGRDRGQRQQCPALSAEEVVSQGKTATAEI